MTINVNNTLAEQAVFIPDLPRNSRITDDKGEMSPDWLLFFDQLITTLSGIFTAEGFSIPLQTTPAIAKLIAPQSESNFIYDKILSVFQGCQQVPLVAADGTVSYTWSNMVQMQFGSGAPGSTHAGIKNNLYRDTSAVASPILYICTKTGDGSGTDAAATWLAI